MGYWRGFNTSDDSSDYKRTVATLLHKTGSWACAGRWFNDSMLSLGGRSLHVSEPPRVGVRSVSGTKAPTFSPPFCAPLAQGAKFLTSESYSRKADFEHVHITLSCTTMVLRFCGSNSLRLSWPIQHAAILICWQAITIINQIALRTSRSRIITIGQRNLT